VTEKKDSLRAYWERLLDERLRSYVVVAAAALLVIFVSGLLAGSLPAGLTPALIGLIGLGLRWPVMPVLVVITVAWFQAMPFGVPIRYMRPLDVDPRFTHFRFGDILIVAAVLVYLIAQFRLYTLTHAAVPDDRIFRARRKQDLPDLRDPGRVEEREIPQLLVFMGVALVAGQILWLFLSETVLDFHKLPPLELREGLRSGSLPYHASREVVFAVGLGVSIFLARLGLWYWRLRSLNREEAQLVLADTGWNEMRREAARLETWRIYGKLRARGKVVVSVPRRKTKKKREPWLAAAVGRACLTLFIAVFIALVVTCGGSYLFLQLFQ
jgi:hypothetical protein